MRCKVCGENTVALWTPEQTEIVHEQRSGPWYRCVSGCGSDCCPQTYADFKNLYDYSYLYSNVKKFDGLEGCLKEVRANADWFQDYRHFNNGAGSGVPSKKDFLDIGFAEGAMLAAMQERGWSVHGFDVTQAAYLGTHTTIAPHFHANLFSQKFAAVNCREVIEHVEDWRSLLVEAHAALHRGGLFQLQTPRPWHTPHPIPYQVGHLQIFSPFVLRYWLEKLGFAVLDFRLHEAGQVWMCQKVDG